jgi:glucuronate isomerase
MDIQNKKKFIDKDFLLQNKFAKMLYHDFAKKMPIIDYHCHLSPKDIAENRQFDNISQVWLAGDHYKWRAMRTLGINEKYITGKASDKDKFKKWAEAVPMTIRNPLFHWTHMELQAYFGIDSLLSPKNASEVYKKTTELLQNEKYSTQELLAKMNVEVVCTTDDPTDNLVYHILAKKNGTKTKLVPTFRPDKVYNLDNLETYKNYLKQLSVASKVDIKTYAQLLVALQSRVDFFNENGAKLSDHGLECMYFFEKGSFDIEVIFAKALQKKPLTIAEKQYFQFETLSHLCKMYHQKGWVQQFHLGALRNTNQRMLSVLGPDTGFDSIGDYPQAIALSKFLNHLDSTNQLAKSILYNLNTADNDVMATMIGNFNDGSVKGKIQFGSAWWFLDQKDGMEKQLNALSNFGILSTFVGMLTDSRSFLSFPRHDYFRRILCNLIGEDVKNGLLPKDKKLLGKIVADICYNNAVEFFKF